MRLFHCNQWGCTDNVRLIRNSLLSETLLTSNETTVCRKPSSFAPATTMMLPNRCNWRLLWKTFNNDKPNLRACNCPSLLSFVFPLLREQYRMQHIGSIMCVRAFFNSTDSLYVCALVSSLSSSACSLRSVLMWSRCDSQSFTILTLNLPFVRNVFWANY